MKNVLVAPLALIGSLALSTTSAFAAPAPSPQDLSFARFAAQAGMAEVDAAQAAQTKSTNPYVRRFAARMIHDHTRANDQLLAILQRQGIPAPASIGAMNRAQIAKVGMLSGSSFNVAYLHAQEKDHQMVIEHFQQEISSGSDPALVAFAKKTLPTLEMHLSMDRRDIAAIGGQRVGQM